LQFFESVPSDFIKFFLVLLFSLLFGLEQQRRNLLAQGGHFGSSRTFALIGILGFVLHVISPKGDYIPFLYGGLVVAAFFLISYWWKIKNTGGYGLSSILVGLITYCITPMVYNLPAWLTLLIVIGVLMVAEIKEKLYSLTAKLHQDEFISLAKFLAISGVILPLLPHEPISQYINISPYKFWLTVVVVSGISYTSYLVKKFIFPSAGPLLTGVLGGLYSSTATTVILARKSKETVSTYQYSAAVIVATAMMYLRILILAFIFNKQIALYLLIPFAICMVVALGFSFFFYRKGKNEKAERNSTLDENSTANPLEFKTAILFSVLFIAFTLITHYVKMQFGAVGISLMSFIVGLTDIDPFILSIFEGKWEISPAVLAIATLNAIASNNCMKFFYALSLGDKAMKKNLIIGFGVLVVIGLISTAVLSCV